MRIIAAIITALTLASCGGSEESVSEAPDAAPDAAPEAAIFETQINALDRAKDVEEANERKKKAVDDALRRAEGDPP